MRWVAFCAFVQAAYSDNSKTCASLLPGQCVLWCDSAIIKTRIKYDCKRTVQRQWVDVKSMHLLIAITLWFTLSAASVFIYQSNYAIREGIALAINLNNLFLVIQLRLHLSHMARPIKVISSNCTPAAIICGRSSKSTFSLLCSRQKSEQRLNESDENTKTSSQVDKSLNKLVPFNRNLLHASHCRVIGNSLRKTLWGNFFLILRRCDMRIALWWSKRYGSCISVNTFRAPTRTLFLIEEAAKSKSMTLCI